MTDTPVMCAKCKEWTTVDEPCCPTAKVIHEGETHNPEDLANDWKGGEA